VVSNHHWSQSKVNQLELLKLVPLLHPSIETINLLQNILSSFWRILPFLHQRKSIWFDLFQVWSNVDLKTFFDHQHLVREHKVICLIIFILHHRDLQVYYLRQWSKFNLVHQILFHLVDTWILFWFFLKIQCHFHFRHKV